MILSILKNTKNSTKGYLYALVATIAFSNIYIFSKAALNEVTLAQFGFYWFALGLFFNLIYIIKTGELKQLKQLDKNSILRFMYLWVLELATTASFFISIQIIPDPAVTSFLGNLYVVFLVILGVIMLKERFSKLESIGVLLTIGGAFAVGYKGGTSLKDFFIPGTGMVLINCFLAAYTSIVAKKVIHQFSPIIVNVNRTLSLFIFSFIYLLVTNDSFTISSRAFTNIAIGAFLGPFAAILAIYFSFKYIEASRSSVIQGLKGFFVLVGSFVYFSTLPTTIQLIGGFVSIVGVLTMSFSKMMNKKFNKTKSQ